MAFGPIGKTVLGAIRRGKHFGSGVKNASRYTGDSRFAKTRSGGFKVRRTRGSKAYKRGIKAGQGGRKRAALMSAYLKKSRLVPSKQTARNLLGVSGAAIGLKAGATGIAALYATAWSKKRKKRKRGIG